MSSIEEKDRIINELQIALRAAIYAKLSIATDHYLALSHATAVAKAAVEDAQSDMREFHELYGDRRGVGDRKDIFEGPVIADVKSSREFMSA